MGILSLEVKKAKAAIQAILFASGDPISIEKISNSLELDKPTVLKLLKNLEDDFDKDESGLCIINLDNKFQMCTKPVFSDIIRKALDFHKKTPLSQAGIEVLSIIAYNQPVTKSFVEKMRGVDCSSIISNLTVRNLIEEKGRLNLPGNPILYGTTLNFLKCFGISSLKDLPKLKERS